MAARAVRARKEIDRRFVVADAQCERKIRVVGQAIGPGAPQPCDAAAQLQGRRRITRNRDVEVGLWATRHHVQRTADKEGGGYYRRRRVCIEDLGENALDGTDASWRN